MYLENSINSFKTKRNIIPVYLLNKYFFYQFVNNFLALLLRKINCPDIFNMVNFFSEFYSIGKYFKFSPNLIFGWEVFMIFQRQKLVVSTDQLRLIFQFYLPQMNVFFSNYNFTNLITKKNII